MTDKREQFNRVAGILHRDGFDLGSVGRHPLSLSVIAECLDGNISDHELLRSFRNMAILNPSLLRATDSVAAPLPKTEITTVEVITNGDKSK